MGTHTLIPGTVLYYNYYTLDTTGQRKYKYEHYSLVTMFTEAVVTREYICTAICFNNVL